MLFSSGVFDVVEPNSPAPALPLRLTNSPDPGRTTSRLLMILPGLAILSIPAGVATYLLMGTNEATLDHYDGWTIAALAAQPVLWFALAILGCMTILPRLKRARSVTLTLDHVIGLEQSVTGTQSWRQPIRAYRGIAHHVRASAGVVTHELILVHANPARSVLLHTAPIVNQASIDHYCTLLRLPVVGSREVYQIRFPALLGQRGRRSQSEPQGHLAMETQG